MVNIVTRPMPKSIGVVKRSLPPHIVAIQLRIFTPVGTAMNIVDIAKAATEIGPMPEENMWCAHTPQPMNPIAMPENTMDGEPKGGVREQTGMISDTMPSAGMMRM